MASIIQLTRRAPGGAAGAPSTAKSAQVSYNMADGTLYIGYGDDGAGNATSVKAFAKDDFSTAHRVPAGGTSGQILTKSSSSDYAFVWSNAPQTLTAGMGITISGNSVAVDTGTIATVSSVTTGLSAKAPIASPAFTGTPAAPTAAAGTSTTQLATTAYVRGEINTLIGGAGAAYDTLIELQSAIQNDDSLISSLTTTVGGKLSKASNLSDLTDLSAGRNNLGLGSMAVQAAAGVVITGGTLANATMSNCTFDGGTF